MVNELTIAFHPYRAQNLVPLTLREVLRDDYLRGAIMWLLGYGADQPLAQQISQRSNQPICAQQVGSAWQVAWTVRNCLAAREIFVRDSIHGDLVREIDRKMVGDVHLMGVIPWLRQAGYPITDSLTQWDNRLYDTGIVVEALALLAHQYPSHNKLEETIQVMSHGVLWLVTQFKEQKGLDKGDNSAMDKLLISLLTVRELYPAQFQEIQNAYEEMGGADLIIDIASWILAHSQISKASSDLAPELLPANPQFLSTLSRFLSILDDEWLEANQVIPIMIESAKKIEKILTYEDDVVTLPTKLDRSGIYIEGIFLLARY